MKATLIIHLIMALAFSALWSGCALYIRRHPEKIAGYNTMPFEKLCKIDLPRIGRFISNMLFAAIPFILVSPFMQSEDFCMAMLASPPIISAIAAALYVNLFEKRFLKTPLNITNEQSQMNESPTEKNDYKEKNHIYYGELPTIDSTDVRLITLEETYGPDELFDELERKLEFPYFGRNWDALNDLLLDLFWIKEKHIIIAHPVYPHLNKECWNIYLEILEECIDLYKRYDNGQRLYIVFPEKG